MTVDTESDFKDLAKMSVPVKRAAYSDRTAWTMAILSELVYVPFDEESKQPILALAKELAMLTDQDKIAERLTAFQTILVPHTNVCTIQPPAGQPRRGKRLRMCSCPRISGEVVYRSVDGRLRGPRFWWGACSTAAGPTSRC